MSWHLEHELEQLKRKLLYVGSLAESSIRKVSKALRELDPERAREVIMMDHQIDLKEVEIEEDCLKILALHQPVAIDLRFVVSALKINNDLERIGDLAVNIAERVLYISRMAPVTAPFDAEEMSGKVLKMVKNALDSLVKFDANLAKAVCDQDDEIDEINRAVYQRVFDGIRANPELVEPLIHYLSISRHLERVADYATNISEDVIYMIDGRIIRHQGEKKSGKDESIADVEEVKKRSAEADKAPKRPDEIDLN